MKEVKNNAMEKVENIIREKHGENVNEPMVTGNYHDGKMLAENGGGYETNGGNGSKGVKGDRSEKKTDKPKNVGYKAAVISLSVATAVLSGALITSLSVPSKNDVALESGYQKSFYETVAQVDNIDLNLSKILATKDDKAIQKYFTDLAVNGELAENELQALPLADESKFNTTKLVNQIADFAKYANKKLIDGKKLSESDYETLNALYKANLNLKRALAEVNDTEGISFKDFDENGSVAGIMTELENLSVEMPELIYDGPFSDGKDDAAPKGLKGEAVNEDYAKKVFVKLFGDRKLKDVSYDGQTSVGIECFNFSATAKGDYMYAQISKAEGKLIMMAMSGSCGGVNVERRVALENAERFARKTGIRGLKAVWANLANNVYTFNFAAEQNGVIIYPDLVKVRVCAETGNVIGFEAASYYTNHTEREIPTAKLKESTARAKVFDGIKIDSARLCVIPATEKTERLCYEFCGSMDDSTYYVYIDAENGNQVEMFKVVEGTEGTLLM